MKVLLHAPLHPTLWIYLMEALKEHEFFIEPTADFQEADTPRTQIKYEVVPRKPNSNFDVQIIALHGIGYHTPQELLKIFPVPVVWIEFQRTLLPFTGNYPLITTCQTSCTRRYPNWKYWCPVVSRTLWNEDWIGDVPIINCTVGAYACHPDLVPILNYLKKENVPLDMRTTSRRLVPFADWKSKFIHDRVLFELTLKPSSFTILEATTIGMPVVTLNWFDHSKMIRDNIDGFTFGFGGPNPAHLTDLTLLLNKFLNDYDFAKEWGKKSKERGNQLNSIENTKTIWNQAFEDSIRIFKQNPGNPFGKEKKWEP
jgi:hypothetical protein